jgi:mxaJ protein
MSSLYSALLAAASIAPTAFAAGAALRVCAEPGNLPYSNVQQQGFENRLAQLVAQDLGRKLEYVWTAEIGDFLGKTLNARRCDVIMGLPSGIGDAQTTHPYYRSSYVFVSRRDRRLHVSSFDDPVLKKLRIGLHVIGGDDGVFPPAAALIHRGLRRNIKWYRAYPDLSKPNGPAELIKAVERGEIDVAVAWGPLAGYIARRASTPLDVVPVAQQFERSMPLAFDISMGVRRGDAGLLSKLNAILTRRRGEIRRLLASYGVPLAPASAEAQGGE